MSRLAELANRFELATTYVELGGRTLTLTHPQSVDDLIDEDDFNARQRLPYWGAVWPSARMLAEQILLHDGRGKRLLELGCGVGLVSLSAALAGFEVLATDYYEEACQFTVVNAEQNSIAGVSGRPIDWREYPRDLREFDYILASDVLYERPNAALVATAVAQSLKRGGVALITDPGRRVARPFAEQCRERGLWCDCVELQQIVDGAMDNTVELWQAHWAAAPPRPLGAA